jgi:putative transposase
MTESGNPLDNAIAERINGILKEEYLNHYKINSLPDAIKQLHKTISMYNNQRPHMSIGNMVPNKVHSQDNVPTQRLWKNYYKKLYNFNQNYSVNLLQDLSGNL